MHQKYSESQLPEKISILVVDNDESVLRALSHQLKDTYTIYSATRPVYALDILKRNEIHIVLCDPIMPDKNGAGFLVKIKDDYPNIVRILFSASRDTSFIMEAINKANIFKFIPKPWGIDLEETLEEAKQFYLARIRNQYTDVITNLRSSTAILDVFHSEVKRCVRYHIELGIIHLKIANPKSQSELHNFLVDRFLLRKIADILLADLRDSDIAGRLRDNSFLILLTETDAKGTQAFLNRFIKSVRKFDVEINRGLLPFETYLSMTSSGEIRKQSVEEILQTLNHNLKPIEK